MTKRQTETVSYLKGLHPGALPTALRAASIALNMSYLDLEAAVKAYNGPLWKYNELQ